MAEMRHPELEGVLREERELVLALGGFALEFAGGILVTNERIPVPRFNFVQELSLSRERMSAFFEKALDHYFQRAIRPEFHLPEPAPAHLAAVLEHYGFSPRAEPRSILLCPRSVPLPPPPPGFSARAAAPGELDIVVDFLAAPRERDELRRGLEVMMEHPNPDERLVPAIAFDGRAVASAALLHRHRARWGIHAVATQPSARGRGAASALVLAALDGIIPAAEGPVAIWADHARIRRRLEALGFHEIARRRVFQLDPKAELHLPPPGPTPGPLWRPPRRPVASEAP
jgi:GNAT superfamily N-acetyltransferase